MRVIKHTRYRVTDGDYWKKGDVESIANVSEQFCCDGMREAWRDNFIGFGEFDSMLNRDSDVNIYTCSPYPEGAVWDALAIKFCPFCAAEVEIEERDATQAA